MVRHARTRGFTLIEVLISSMVLAVIIYLGTLSYSMFLSMWGERRLLDTKAVNKYRSHMLLRSSLESVYDYYVTDRANERLGLYYPFFKGEKDEMEFVTLSSVFKKGFPAAARLRITASTGSNRREQSALKLASVPSLKLSQAKRSRMISASRSKGSSWYSPRYTPTLFRRGPYCTGAAASGENGARVMQPHGQVLTSA